ncbi:MAG: hypothetical protein IKU26_03170 [Clostridia bacterium]|nr:hypothetical protein [Clostridia bacterium]
MNKITYTREQVAAAYDELKRRINQEVAEYPEAYNGYEMPENVYFETARAMVDGLYSVLMATAANWPEIVQWTDQEEMKRGLLRA